MRGYKKHGTFCQTFRQLGTWDIYGNAHGDICGGIQGERPENKASEEGAPSPFLWEAGELELTVRSLEHERRNAPVTDLADPDKFKSQKCEIVRNTEK